MNINPEFYEEDDEDWEDKETYSYILSTLPEGWTLVRVMAGWASLEKMREWLKQETLGPYREVNWANGGCSYSVGVMLEHPMDIVLFKLAWGY